MNKKLISIITVALSIFTLSCEDRSASPWSSGPDLFLPSPVRDASSDPDAIVDAGIPEWDAAVDAEVDAEVDAGPPVVCTPAGATDPCQIVNLQGPCSYGERSCLITEWSSCRQVVNPRMEVCNRMDDDCDGSINEAPGTSQNNTLSQPCYDAPLETLKVGLCVGGTRTCELDQDFGWGYHRCVGQQMPRDEACDLLDNDCDGSTDEGVTNACGQCAPLPEEVCDSLDNDCDGLTDEGLLNACFRCGELPDETCDDIDNDCDGQVDEGFLNACGLCGDLPSELCDYIDNDCDGQVDEGLGNCECGNPTYVPQPEVCNGIDEDCDGQIDEGPNGGPLTTLCATDVLTGEINTFDRREDGPQYVGNHCRVGLAFCEERQDDEGEAEWGYFECLQEILPANERCNDIDDDCDGIPDEGFNQGTVAVMVVMDISGSMQADELNEAFTSITNTIQNLFDEGAMDICYLLAVVGNDHQFDPYLSVPAHTCVPGFDAFSNDDMSNAVSILMTNLRNGTINQGGSSENTFDAMGDFFTDDLIDWDQDGTPDDIVWNTNDPNNPVHSIDLSAMNHRIVVVMGDEPGQGDFWDEAEVVDAMRRSQGMAFIIGTPDQWVRDSYQNLIAAGAEYYSAITRRAGARNERTISEAVQTAIDEAACLQEDDEEEEEEVPAEEEEPEMACIGPVDKKPSLYKRVMCRMTKDNLCI